MSTERTNRKRLYRESLTTRSNAHKYGPADQPIRLTATCPGDCVRVEMRDQGEGIALAEQRGLFQRFMRMASNGARAQSGVGFRLAITKEIVEMHHGQIGLESTVGQGTTVWFTLPLAARENASETISEVEAP